jgi:hypothetical protein
MPATLSRVRADRAAPVRRRTRPGTRFDLSSLKARARWFVLLAALLAFSWQGIVAETHRHLQGDPARGAVVAKRDGGSKPGQPRPPADSPANCPICRELAHAAFYLPPAPIVFDTPLFAVALLASVAALFLTLRRRSHGWRSRAPPICSGT